MTPNERALLDWHDAEYARRSAAVLDGTARIDWIVPEYRVSWSELAAKADELGIDRNLVDLRRWWDQHKKRRRRP